MKIPSESQSSSDLETYESTGDGYDYTITGDTTVTANENEGAEGEDGSVHSNLSRDAEPWLPSDLRGTRNATMTTVNDGVMRFRLTFNMTAAVSDVKGDLRRLASECDSIGSDAATLIQRVTRGWLSRRVTTPRRKNAIFYMGDTGMYESGTATEMVPRPTFAFTQDQILACTGAATLSSTSTASIHGRTLNSNSNGPTTQSRPPRARPARAPRSTTLEPPRPSSYSRASPRSTR